MNRYVNLILLAIELTDGWDYCWQREWRNRNMYAERIFFPVFRNRDFSLSIFFANHLMDLILFSNIGNGSTTTAKANVKFFL